jgi:hypothetical protein
MTGTRRLHGRCLSLVAFDAFDIFDIFVIGQPLPL